MKIFLVAATLLSTAWLSACTMPSVDSEEFKYNKMLMDQRSQCRQLPEPLASSCISDLTKKSYQEFKNNRAQAKDSQ